MFWIPTGFNRADGTTNLPSQPSNSGGPLAKVGTPNPVGQTSSFSNALDGSTPTIEEDGTSPEIERAEQATSQHRLKMAWQEALNLLSVMGRGTFLTDSFGNIWRVLSSKINHIRSGGADMGELSYTAESISFDSPPDDYQMIPVELGIDIIKHPRYFYALYPSGTDFVDSVGTPVTGPFATRAAVKMAIIRAIQTYRDSPYFPPVGSTAMNGTVQNNVINYFIQSLIPTLVGSNSETQIDISGDAGSLLAAAAAGEIIYKLWNQLDTPYIAGFQVAWSQYYFAPVFENPGSYVESPIGIVPDYFLSPSQDGSDTIFDQMGNINPQCFSASGAPIEGANFNISWLRKADEVEYQRTWFKVTRTWIGSPIGHWDAQIFSQGNRPSSPSDYLPLPNGTVPVPPP